MFIASLLVATLLGAPAGPPDPGVATGPFDAAVDRFMAPPGSGAASRHFDAAVDRRGRIYVTEGDTLVRLAPRGRRAAVASFPSRVVPAPARLPDGTPRGMPVRMQPVLTAVVQGPDGAFYVGELAGYPFAPGRARVWRVVPGRPPEVYAGGFTAAVDLAWGPGGLYVLDVARNGMRAWALVRVGDRGRHRVVASAGPGTPSGLTIHGRYAYVTACPDCPATARVRRIDLGAQAQA
ncbi:ScyD/ScyE family protein [Actinoplanes sp. TRM 88003]|uniref:ScyD/ScyE family protein n=1 Tax=Paractinoplanes aksuensis TaxID=2939490 RepID=A0ABT1DKM4_9ACTN|nr:ScyD/ScyE family protein [Actinoplanes aksuensis]MCO8271397.1 ScyD/ScyE family protein [Actinoplanes aksuensis]